MKKDWVWAVLGKSSSDPLDVSAAQQISTVVQRVIGEDNTSPSHGDAAPRPISAEDVKDQAQEEAKDKEQEDEKPAALPPN